MSIKGFWVKGQVQKYDYQELENLPLEKIFWAVYNTTTFTDIETASNAGKIVMLQLPAQLNNVIIPLSCFTTDGGTKHAEFYGVSGSGRGNSYVYIAYCDEGTNFWSMSRQLISGLAPIQKVNNKTGNVTLDASDVGALPASTVIPSKTSDLINDEGFINTSQAPVRSVNGQTGTISIPVLPSGGNVGQVLAKASNNDYETEWVNQSGGSDTVPSLPTGGTVGQVLTLMPSFPVGSDPIPIWSDPQTVIFNFTLDANDQVSSGPIWNDIDAAVIDAHPVVAHVTKNDGTELFAPLVYYDDTPGAWTAKFSAANGYDGLFYSIVPGEGVANSWVYNEWNINVDLADLYESKLDNNFGSSEAGKILVVGSDGAIRAVTMAEWQGGNY